MLPRRRKSLPVLLFLPMISFSNPTVTVLVICFATSLATFVVAAAFRAITAPRPSADVPAPADLPAAGNDGSPYQPPNTLPAVPPPLPTGKVAVGHYRKLDLIWMGFIALMFAFLSLGNATVAAEKTDIVISANGLLQSIGFQLFITTLTIAMVVWRVNPVAWLGLRWPGWRWVLLIAPVSVLTMWFVSAGLFLSGYMELMKSLGVESTQDSVKLLQQTKDPLVLTLMAVAAVLVAPICEEIVFRGYLYPAAKRFAGPWVAGGATALIFAAAHGALAPLLPLFVFGALLVLAYELTGSLWAPMAMHFCFNGATVAIQLAVRLSGVEIPENL